MKFWQKLILVVLTLTGLFVFTAPASLITEFIPENQSNIHFSGLQGTAINGSAQRITLDNGSIENVQWDLDMISSLSGTPAAAIQIADPGINISSDASYRNQRNWSVTQLNGTLTLAEWVRFIPRLRLINLDGKAQLSDVSVALTDTAFTAGDGQIIWNNAAMVIANQRFDLSSIRASLALEGTQLLVNYRGDSPLQPNGTIRLAASGEYQMVLNIEPTALPSNMQWMTRMGQRSESGEISYSMKGQIKL